MALRCSASRGDECAPEQAQMREERRAEGLGAKGPRESPGTWNLVEPGEGSCRGWE